MGNILWLDLETTGLLPERHGVVELAAVFEQDGVEVGSFSSHMRPPFGTEYAEEALRTTKLTVDEILDFPLDECVVREFMDWLEQWVDPWVLNSRTTLAGYNVEFDKRFLEKLMARAGYQYDRYFWHDLLDVRSFTTYHLHAMRSRLPNGKLMTAAEQILLPEKLTAAMGGGKAHGAPVDIRVTIEIFRALNPTKPRRPE